MGYKAEQKDFEKLCKGIQDQHIQDRIQICGNWYIKKANRCKHIFYILSLVNILFPLIITCANAVSENMELIKLISVLCSTITAACSSILTFTKVLDKWNLYRTTIESIKSRLALHWATDSKEQNENQLMKDIEVLMQEESSKWKILLMDNEDNKEQDNDNTKK